MNTQTNEKCANKVNFLTVLKANDLTMFYKDGSQFKVMVLNGQGKPYAGQSVTFNINGVIYNRTTDANGYAALNIRLGRGQYTITSSYCGLNIANQITIK